MTRSTYIPLHSDAGGLPSKYGTVLAGLLGDGQGEPASELSAMSEPEFVQA